MDWFHNLDQEWKDSVVQFLSQGIEYYGNFNESGVKDVEQKFGINPLQTQQLYEFLYFKETAELTEGLLSKQNHIHQIEIINHAECFMCLETMVNPTTITCGHTYCAACLYNFCIARPRLHGRKPCPICRVNFDTNKNYPVNVELRNQIEDMNNNILNQ